MSRIELRNINKYYGSSHVLRDVNLTIEDGDFMTLLGPSGCGKTTTLRILSGLEKPEGGTMLIDGKTMIDAQAAFYEEPSKRELNLVFQSYALWPHMTVFENVSFGLKIKKMPKREIEESVTQALKTMRIGEYASRYPNELSGGQQQRVAIARALALHPKMLYFDEPTSALDPEITAEILRVMKSLAAEKMTMAVVTHEIDFARAVSNKVVFMDGGMVIEEGKPEDVIDNPKNERTKAFLKKLHI